ncbi:glycosyl transferase, family 39 [Streptomyces cinnamoneus]|nr:glycosyl transferase, family 39 [Streptomyces cinnamoneus]
MSRHAPSGGRRAHRKPLQVEESVTTTSRPTGKSLPTEGQPDDPAQAEAASGLPPLAWKPVTAVAAVLGLLLLATSGRWGYQGDELYFLGASEHLSWGYADNPPLLPLLAGAMDSLFGGSLVGLRLPSTILAATGTLFAALIARELGGETKAQLRTAVAWAAVPLVMIVGHALSASTVDLFAWTAVTWLLVAWVRRQDDRLLLWIALVSVVSMQAKYSIVFLWVAVGISALAVGPRRLLRRPMLWVGAAVVFATVIPGLLWQADHGWPQLHMADVFRRESAGPVAYVGVALFLAGLLLVVLSAHGLWQLLRSPDLRPYRFLGWSFVGLFVFFLVTGGRPTYVAGLFPLLWAAGAVRMQRGTPAKWWRWAVSWPVFGLVAALSIVTSLPVLPRSDDDPPVAGTDNNPQAAETVGWDDLVTAVEKATQSVPAGEREHAAIVTEYYTEAGALEHLGRGEDLPKVYSAHRGYWYFGGPSDDATTTIFVGSDREELLKRFSDVREAATTAGKGNAVAGTKVWICKGNRQPWSQMWPDMGHLY